MLQLVEFEWNKSIDKKPYVPLEDRNASYKEFFSKFNFGTDRKLITVKKAVDKKDYTAAIKLLRKYFSKKKIYEKKFGEKSKNILKTADKFYQHKFDFNNIKRTLLFDINSWYPFKNDILKNWDVTRSLTLACRPVKFNELKKISPMADWYNQLNTLPHLDAFGKAYAISKKSKYASKYMHDLQDWMYDNPVPSSPTALPGPWYISLAATRLNGPLLDYVSLFANSSDVSDVEFFYLINTIQKHKDYLKTCMKSDMFNENEKNDADKALYSESLTLKIK